MPDGNGTTEWIHPVVVVSDTEVIEERQNLNSEGLVDLE